MNPTHESRPKLHPGQVFVTPAALAACPCEYLSQCLRRHVAGDWGLVDDDDRASNEDALKHGERLLSAYPRKTAERDGERVWIITEGHRLVTTMLLPEDY